MKEGNTDNFCGTAFAYCLTEDEKDKIIDSNNVPMTLRIK